jgi:hypothetical protein
MTKKMIIQDYIFASAILLSVFASLVTWYALYTYPCLICERNPVTRYLLQNDFSFFFAKLAMLVFICMVYRSVRRKYLVTLGANWFRMLFNTVVGFVFLLHLWDAANDAIILLGASLPGLKG